jgi:cysteinyl-tRNA synthetase
MAHQTAPDDIVQLADARAAARRTRDWATADALRARIEAAGWNVIDVGTLYDLERAAPADIRDGETIRYGASASVPSRLAEAPVGTASVVLTATDWPEDVERTVRALAATSPAGTQVIVVANAESEAQTASLAALEAAGPPGDGIALEVLRTSVRLGFATALNMGIRRAAGPVVLVMDCSAEPQGDLVTPLVTALEDPKVAVAGPFGVVSEDMRRFAEPAEGVVAVDAIEGYAMAFRREDYAARGPLDEHFAFFRHLDIWWSLVLRDQGEEEPDDAAPRCAVRVPGIAIQRHPHREWASLADRERDRLSKKNYYRVLKRFASRRDMLVGAAVGEPGG